jgi:hypothetical protein
MSGRQLYKTNIFFISIDRLYILSFSLAVFFGLSSGVAMAWSNPSQTAPSGQPGPIVVALGGTQASMVPQALTNLGMAGSGADTSITSLSPSGNLVLTPTGYVGIGTASPGLELGINGGVLANEGLPSCTPTNAGYSFNGDGCYDTGMFSSGDGDLRLYDNQVLTLHATPSGVIIPTGLAIGTTTIPASGIEFPDGTVQTTAM